MGARGREDDLDAQLAHWVSARDRMAVALVELEQHPGLRLLTSISPTGATAHCWATARVALAGLWQDFAVYRDVVDAAQAIPERRRQRGEPESATLRRLLVEPSIEVARTVVPLPERGLIGSGEHVHTITLAQLVARMQQAFTEVSALVVSCDAVHREVLTGLIPLAERVRAARELSAGLATGEGVDPDVGAVAALTARIDELGCTATTDPLALATRSAVELAELDADIAAVMTRLAELAALREGWETALATVTARLAELTTLRQDEDRDRRRAQELIATSGLATPPDRLPALRARLDALAAPAGWAARAQALAALRTAVADATHQLHAAHQLATGLLERRTELRGRYEAYRAKAARLGHAERPELLELDDRIREVLWTRPCDLAAATRALKAYQQLLTAYQQLVPDPGRPV